ncbi:MAG TPA: hypothetical protein VN366_03495 [Feifaniaceae bacterium]|nr:hypothetical protein [Feifaniaceae bacterium]
MKRVYVLLGNFGSGKTELAINFAVNAAQDSRTVLADLDVINPYFRSAERKAELESANVKLIHPVFAYSTVEVPALSPEVYSIFTDRYDTAVIDAGGDPSGAAALGQYKSNFVRLPEGALSVFLVVNPFRPFSATPGLVLDLMERLEARARLKITGLINNANLSTETEAEHLIAGYELLRAVAEASKIPVAYTAGTKDNLEKFLNWAQAQGKSFTYIGTPMKIELYMHRDWDRFTRLGI